jgi:uncharacterized protein (DUF2126 family)
MAHDDVEPASWRLYLIAGDSPIGLRLPLDSLTWSALPVDFERSPFERATGSLRRVRCRRRDDRRPPRGRADGDRDRNSRRPCPGLPPAARERRPRGRVVERRRVGCGRTGRAVVIEGYPLPRDPLAHHVGRHPDPGVIEVNVQPSASWDELRHVIETVYDEARLTRLGTEKFDLDGSHTGTGGGNHVTLGGATPADSPVLRRPDLLRSMVTFWQHHPAMSYLFSGQFIGPTSQAPRVDEGRVDTVYELEIAFAELERHGEDVPPWMVDRLLRHLLVDLTGNTHRSEFCIDKLFSPDSERGRLGIVELRAFEMPPHPQMALVQSLLVRALVARFWDDPYSGRLVRWGTDLYDRYLLPWYVRADIHDVVDDLAATISTSTSPGSNRSSSSGSRSSVKSNWTTSDWNCAVRSSRGTSSARRSPARGTARYVDSSVERLQVLVEGFNEARHILTCNGVPVPLHTTSTPGTGVAGIRFKAWAPWSALHPTIDAHGPLVFDLIDRWSSKSVGGCTYEVSPSRRTLLRHVPRERRRGRGPPVQQVLQARPHARRGRRRRTRPARRDRPTRVRPHARPPPPHPDRLTMP